MRETLHNFVRDESSFDVNRMKLSGAAEIVLETIREEYLPKEKRAQAGRILLYTVSAYLALM